MEKETYDEVITKVIDYLRETSSRKEETFRCYQTRWRKVKSYMNSQNIIDIDASVCRDYLQYEFSNRDFKGLTQKEKEFISSINILIEFLETGAIQNKKEQIDLIDYGNLSIIDILTHLRSKGFQTVYYIGYDQIRLLAAFFDALLHIVPYGPSLPMDR